MKKNFLFFAIMLLLLPAFSQAYDVSNVVTEYSIGDFKVYSVLDTPMEIRDDLLFGDKTDIQKLVPTGKCVSSLNVFVLKYGEDIILFDTGLGTFGNGQTVKHLTNMGIAPDNVTKVFFTHLHGDHFGGSLYAGKKVFPNATLYVAEEELGFWSNKKNGEAVGNLKETYGNNLQTFKSGIQVLPNIKSVPAFGHTAGHTMYEVSSKNGKMLIWGDIMHCFEAQIKNPAISIAYDSDRTKAVETRANVLKNIQDGGIVAGAHLPYPGVIKIKKNGNKYGYEKVQTK